MLLLELLLHIVSFAGQDDFRNREGNDLNKFRSERVK